MPGPKPEPPRLWIVAGPNGSGKSTLYRWTDIEGAGRSVWIINPDALSARLADHEGLSAHAANGEALDRILAWLIASVDAHQTVGVETVLSTDKYRSLVEHAKNRGFEILLLFVTLRTVDLNIERVRIRVAAGGHPVAEDKIRKRRLRSFEQLPWFLNQADQAFLYDNSGPEPLLIGTKTGGEISLDPLAPEEIRRAVETLATE